MEAPSEDRVDELELEGQTDLANEPQSPAAEDENVSPFFMNSESRRLSLTSDVMQEETCRSKAWNIKH